MRMPNVWAKNELPPWSRYALISVSWKRCLLTNKFQTSARTGKLEIFLDCTVESLYACALDISTLKVEYVFYSSYFAEA
jgi:hypothetical protein